MKEASGKTKHQSPEIKKKFGISCRHVTLTSSSSEQPLSSSLLTTTSTMDAHDRIPLKTPEVIPLIAMVTSHSLIIGSAVFAVLLLAGIYFLMHRVLSGLTVLSVWLFLNRTSPKRGNHLLLVGPPDAGKTAILSQVTPRCACWNVKQVLILLL